MLAANFLGPPPPRLADPSTPGKTFSMRISPFLWFDDQAEEAAKFYTGIFPNSKIISISRYPDAGQEIHGKPAGSVMVVAFELDGHSVTALNGGPQFKFTEAISLEIDCDTQEEIDYYWAKLSEAPGRPGQCGWLRDKFGLTWQVVPAILPDLLIADDPAAVRRTFEAILHMTKLDIAELQRAFES
jgi:predicted 3-demethylubiquinone-9 3-methyltransferase (glyoxalase superfamily)